jgi:predicted phosphodiesterase
MRCALVSDIHANLEALEAVLASEPVRSADAIVCLGDVVGYHANPNECVELVEQRARLCIAGNHDWAAVGKLDTRDFGRVARVAIAWTAPRLTSKNLGFLADLPVLSVFEQEFVCVHGALHPEPNVTLHLSDAFRAERSFEHWPQDALEQRICFFGHTHRPIVYAYAAGRCRVLEASAVELSPNARYLINPGSVGQSRDRDPRASFLIYDTAARRLWFHRVAYDQDACLRRARQAGLLPQAALGETVQDWLAIRAIGARRLLGRAAYRARRLARTSS